MGLFPTGTQRESQESKEVKHLGQPGMTTKFQTAYNLSASEWARAKHTHEQHGLSVFSQGTLREAKGIELKFTLRRHCFSMQSNKTGPTREEPKRTRQDKGVHVF